MSIHVDETIKMLLNQAAEPPELVDVTSFSRSGAVSYVVGGVDPKERAISAAQALYAQGFFSFKDFDRALDAILALEKP